MTGNGLCQLLSARQKTRQRPFLHSIIHCWTFPGSPVMTVCLIITVHRRRYLRPVCRTCSEITNTHETTDFAECLRNSGARSTPLLLPIRIAVSPLASPQPVIRGSVECRTGRGRMSPFSLCAARVIQNFPGIKSTGALPLAYHTINRRRIP